MPIDINKIDLAITEAEVRITEQVLHIVMLEMEGRDTGNARRSLKAFESILVEYRHARKIAVDAQGLAEHPANNY